MGTVDHVCISSQKRHIDISTADFRCSKGAPSTLCKYYGFSLVLWRLLVRISSKKLTVARAEKIIMATSSIFYCVSLFRI